jgi:hypothetical protein
MKRLSTPFAKTLTWEGRVDKICMPFLCVAGGADELSPVGNAILLFDTLAGPRRLVIYEESRHSVGGGVSSALLGPNATDLSANWIAARFAGLPFPTERRFVSNAGTIATSQL